MKWNPMWGLPYDGYLWSVTVSWAKDQGIEVDEDHNKDDIWNLAKRVANEVETQSDPPKDIDPPRKVKLVPKKSPQTIEQYTKATGKRFRMTKAQKERGLSRTQAFEEYIKDQ